MTITMKRITIWRAFLLNAFDQIFLMKIFKQLFTFLILTTSALFADATPDITHLTAKQCSKLLKENPKIVILDVRTAREFGSGHLKGAKNIDVKLESFAAKAGKLDRSKTYLVHCKSGGRSSLSLPILQKLGLAKIYHMKDGYIAWKKAGLPTQVPQT